MFVSGGMVESDSVLAVLTELMRFEPFGPHLTTYESLRSSGDFGILGDYRLREDLIGYYQSLEWRMHIDGLFSSYLDDYLIPFAIEHVDFARQKIARVAPLRDYRFTNLTLGYGGLLEQNLSYYRGILQKRAALKEKLGASID